MAKPQPLAAEYTCRECGMPFLNSFPLDEHGRCALCRAGLTGFDAAYSFGSFENELRELIHLFKYGRIRPLAKPLGDLMALALPRSERFDVVVPMPMHWLRRWRRGFNQAELLARTIARRASVPVRRLVRRAKWTTPQAGLTNAQRRHNVQRAFRVSGNVDGMRILLVDDVLTTGATAGACAAVLKRAGAARVAVLTVARVDRRIAAAVFRENSQELENAGSRSIA
ncbi:MAG TPA: ComF family protein [Bryobacteraceae bacterium]|nr:ComF family protein [Bryobacteraceae bacterium]